MGNIGKHFSPFLYLSHDNLKLVGNIGNIGKHFFQFLQFLTIIITRGIYGKYNRPTSQNMFITCTDEDFNTASMIVDTLLPHSLHLSTIYTQINRKDSCL